MKIFLFVIFFGFVGYTLAGGVSQCGPFLEKFTPLNQFVEFIVDAVLQGTKRTERNCLTVKAQDVLEVVVSVPATYCSTYCLLACVTVQDYPFVGNSYIESFIFYQNLMNYTFANGISHLSGVNIDYIKGIFNETVSPPFIFPLDCIQTELLSFVTFCQNNIQNGINPLYSLVQTSPVNASTPCQIAIQGYTSYYQLASQAINVFTAIGIRITRLFASIGLSNIYAEYINSAYGFVNLMSDSIAEFLNMDPVLIAQYIANQSISVPPPLTCVQGLINSQINTVNSAVSNAQNNVPPSNIPPNCEPLYSQFQAFEGVWYHYLNQLRDYAINNSIAYPILTPFFLDDLVCEVDVMIIFAANATSTLSGVDSEIIYDILTGVTAAPFAYPLSCIENDLVYLASQISILVNNIIPGLQNFAINSTSDISTCNKTYQALSPYVGTMVTLLNHKAALVANGTTYFTATNFGDLFLGSFASVLSCLPNLVGKYVGAALNTNGSSVTAFISGTRFTMPSPFNCVNILINIINSLMNQAVVNFITGTDVDLSTPNIPRFTG